MPEIARAGWPLKAEASMLDPSGSSHGQYATMCVRAGLVISRRSTELSGESPWLRRRRIPDASTSTHTSLPEMSHLTGHALTSP